MKLAKVVIVLIMLGQVGWVECSDEVVDLRWNSGSVRFNVEIDRDDEERARGLMFVESMGRYKGMLFVYDAPSTVAFWMKNTLIPLDMVFLDQHGVVRHMHENAVPGSLEIIPGNNNILVVLEVNGGLISKLGLVLDAEMRHPVFSETRPAWTC